MEEEGRKIEKIEERYIRWIFGLNRTPGYLSKGRNTKRKIKGKGGKEDLRKDLKKEREVNWQDYVRRK